MKILLKILSIIPQIFFCLCITLTCFYMIFVVNVCAVHPDSQIAFYTLVSLFWSVGIWVIIFVKISNKAKIISWALFILYLFLPYFLPSVDIALEHDSCMDKGGRWDYAHNKCDIQELKSE